MYVGQTVNVRQRLYDYNSTNCKSQERIYNSIKKHGWENHFFEVIHALPESANISELNYWECVYYQFFKGLGYDLMNIAEPGLKVKMSEETKKKISLARIGIKTPGRKLSDKHKQSLSIALKGNRNGVGHKKSDEERKRISERVKEWNKNPEVRERTASIWKGKKLSEEHKAKLSAAKRKVVRELPLL